MKKARNGFIKALPYLCLVGVIALGLMTIVATGGGGNGDDSNTGTLYQYEYDGSGNLVNTTEGGDCDCDFSDGNCSLKYNGLGQLIEECIVGDRPSPCADTKNYYNIVGQVSAIEYFGSCDCEGYIPGEGSEMVCDAIYNSFEQIIRGCVCKDEETDEEIVGDTYVRFLNTLDCNGESYTATFEICGNSLNSETGTWSSCETVNSGNCTWTLSANTACEEIYIAASINLNANCLYSWKSILYEGKPTVSYREECPGDCTTASSVSTGVSPEILSDDDSFEIIMKSSN